MRAGEFGGVHTYCFAIGVGLVIISSFELNPNAPHIKACNSTNTYIARDREKETCHKNRWLFTLQKMA